MDADAAGRQHTEPVQIGDQTAVGGGGVLRWLAQDPVFV